MGRLPDSKRHLQENLFFLQEQLGTDFFGQFVGAGDVGAGFGEKAGTDGTFTGGEAGGGPDFFKAGAGKTEVLQAVGC